jgi:hypothetical protein
VAETDELSSKRALELFERDRVELDCFGDGVHALAP